MSGEVVIKTEKLDHNGKKYEILVSSSENGYIVRILQDKRQIYPNYVIDYGTEFKFVDDKGYRGYEELVRIAKNDIENDFYRKKLA
jgi:phenolic acid decarboxylase